MKRQCQSARRQDVTLQARWVLVLADPLYRRSMTSRELVRLDRHRGHLRLHEISRLLLQGSANEIRAKSRARWPAFRQHRREMGAHSLPGVLGHLGVLALKTV